MNFFKKYELQRLIHEGDVKSFQATERDTGRPVFFHMIQDGSAAAPALTAKARRLNSVLEIGDFGGTTFIVTDPVPAFTNLPDWLDRQVPDREPDSTPSPLRSAAPLPPTPLVAPPTPAAAPGEFTQIFGNFAPPAPLPLPPRRTPAPPSPPATSHEPGEFTRFFGAGVNQEPLDLAPGAPPEPESAKKPFESAGEFTRMFGGSAPPSSSSPDAPLSPQPILTGAPSGSPFDTRLEFTRDAPVPAAAEPAAGPSEFTRAIGPRPDAAPPAPPPVIPAAEATPAPTSGISRKEILILVVSFLGLLGALAFFLFLRHK